MLGLVGFARAAPAWSDMANAFVTPGPNSSGEAGKVYYAHRIQNGLAAFSGGDTPPFYPSFHGALVHASVGYVARLIDAPLSSLYGIGRWISLLMTGVAGGLFLMIGRSTRIPWTPLLIMLLLWSSSYDLIQHSVSYRPDNWVLAVGMLACCLLASPTEGPWKLAVLVALPAVAFHLKATGIVLIAAVGMANLLLGEPRRAAWLGVAQLSLIAASVVVLDHISNGNYLQGLAGAGKVATDPVYLFVSLRDAGPLLTFLLLGPVLLGAWSLREDGKQGGRALRVVVAFWLATLAGSLLASIRIGSGPYYFLEPVTYGLLLVAFSIHRLTQGSERRHIRLGAAGAAMACMALLALPSSLPFAGRERRVSISQVRTAQLGSHRARLAEMVNADGGTCYSDDPGLNVMLREPAVIYPLLQSQMIRAGTLDPATLTSPVSQHDYACVILTGMAWRYMEQEALSAEFVELVQREYPVVESFGGYLIHTRPGAPMF